MWAPNDNPLSFALHEQNLTLEFRPTDFTQVNVEINRKMVSLAVELLQLESNDRVLDLFCGLGNFTLPIARQAGHVVGVEGSVDLVNQAVHNARNNKIENVEFHAVDLTQPLDSYDWAKDSYDKILIDPPRSGAFEVMPVVAIMRPKRIVYVSCNPATLARDAHELVNVHGYKLKKAGAMDMFPNTSHVESIAVFDFE